MTTTQPKPAWQDAQTMPNDGLFFIKDHQLQGLSAFNGDRSWATHWRPMTEAEHAYWSRLLDTHTPPAAPAVDAVEALTNCLFKIAERDGLVLGLPEAEVMEALKADAVDFIKYFAAAGYTLRRETMTEDELEREARDLARLFGQAGAENGHAFAIMALAKKYRG